MGTRIRARTAEGIVSVSTQDLGRWLDRRDAWLWVDLFGDRALAESILRDVFQFHPLVIKACLDDVRNPRVHGFEHYLYLVVHGVKVRQAAVPGAVPDAPVPRPRREAPAEPGPADPSADPAADDGHDDPGSRDFQTVEMDVFLGERFLVTWHHEWLEAIDDAYADTRLPDSTGMSGGPATLLRELLDRLVDQYGPVLDRVDAELGEMETQILAAPGPEHLQTLLAVKRSLQSMRRINAHQQSTILRLGRGEFPQVPEGERPFFRDVTDRMARISDLTETYRETAASLLETHLSVTSNRLNEVMRTLTVVSLLLMPPTLIAGVYGMNFRHMPELQWRFGYGLSLGLMALSSGAGIWFLKRRGMLG